MNRLTLTLSMASILAFPGSGFAEQENQGTDRDRVRAAQGEGRPANQGFDRGERGQAGQFDPEMMIARLMKQFDVDGDEKLDIEELTKLMTTLRDRRQSGGGVGLRDRDVSTGKRGMRPSQSKNRPTPAAGQRGGDRPVRPSAE